MVRINIGFAIVLSVALTSLTSLTSLTAVNNIYVEVCRVEAYECKQTDPELSLLSSDSSRSLSAALMTSIAALISDRTNVSEETIEVIGRPANTFLTLRVTHRMWRGVRPMARRQQLWRILVDQSQCEPQWWHTLYPLFAIQVRLILALQRLHPYYGFRKTRASATAQPDRAIICGWPVTSDHLKSVNASMSDQSVSISGQMLMVCEGLSMIPIKL